MGNKVGFVGTTLCALVTAMCSGTPTAPSCVTNCGPGPGPGPGPEPTQKSNISISFEPVHGTTGSSNRVYIDGVDKGTFAGNSLSLSGVDVGTRVLKISGDIEREVKIDVRQGSENKYENTKALDTNVGVPDFVARFNQAARNGVGYGAMYNNGTTRSLEDEATGRFKGTFYVDISSMRIVPTHFINFHLSNVNTIINRDAPYVYGPVMNGIRIVYACPSGSVGGVRCDTNTLPSPGTENAYILQFSQEVADLKIGALVKYYIKNNVPYRGKVVHNVTYAGLVEAHPQIGKGPLTQDILNILGIVDEWKGATSGSDSIFNERLHPEDPTRIDRVLGHTLYAMPPGTRSVYNTSDFETLSPREVINANSLQSQPQLTPGTLTPIPPYQGGEGEDDGNLQMPIIRLDRSELIKKLKERQF